MPGLPMFLAVRYAPPPPRPIPLIKFWDSSEMTAARNSQPTGSMHLMATIHLFLSSASVRKR